MKIFKYCLGVLVVVIQFLPAFGQIALNMPQREKLGFDSGWLFALGNSFDAIFMDSDVWINVQLLGRKSVSNNVYSNDWSVNFKPGILRAVGYSKGQQVATSPGLSTATLNIK